MRVTCLVPFCRHTRGDRKNDPLPRPLGGYEWICAEHWRPVPRKAKRALAAGKRRGRPSLSAIAWRRCRRKAIEAAVGIAS